MRTLPFLLGILIICKASTGDAQSITPLTINNGGGFATAMEWSIGESVSIANFVTATYSLNTGVLQPTTSSVTAIDPIGNQIMFGPNPVANLLHIKASFSKLGSLSIQLLDAKSIIVFSDQASTVSLLYQKDIVMQFYPSGVYFLRVYFKPTNGNPIMSTYKIIKS